jgi:hypothetical protein
VGLFIGLGVASPVWADVNFEASEPVTERAFVNSAASTDGGEEAWVKVESVADAKSAAWSPRGVCSRIAKAGRKAVLPAMLAACDPASAAVELPSDVAVVQVYDARAGGWEKGLVGDLEVGDEVLHDGHLLRVTPEGVDDRGYAEVGQLSDADATYTVDGIKSVPDGDDWVLVLGDDVDAGHWRLHDLTVGERFAFGGRVFESDVVNGELAVRATGDVLGRVVDTFVRMAPEVIDAEIAYADGTTDVLTGTPNHPFWVDAIPDYVPLGDLKVGTELHVQGGGDAVLVSKTWRQGDFEVIDFEVEGLHNFYVRGPGGDAAGVLVHNSSGDDMVRVFTTTDGPVDLGRAPVDGAFGHGPSHGGTFVTQPDLTDPGSLYRHVSANVPNDGTRPAGSLPSVVTEIEVPRSSRLPDPSDSILRGQHPQSGWIPPNAPSTRVKSTHTVHEPSPGDISVVSD